MAFYPPKNCRVKKNLALITCSALTKGFHGLKIRLNLVDKGGGWGRLQGREHIFP